MAANNLKHPVILNIYDMVLPMNAYTSIFGFGVFHSGTEVHGNEYAFGGHFSPISGIYDMAPKDALSLGESFILKESLVLGYTEYTDNDVQLLISHLGQKYKGNEYHIVRKNCNHFTRDLCLLLVGKEIPKYVNRLATILSYIPYIDHYLENCMGLQGVASSLSMDEDNNSSSVTTVAETSSIPTANPRVLDLKKDSKMPSTSLHEKENCFSQFEQSAAVPSLAVLQFTESSSPASTSTASSFSCTDKKRLTKFKPQNMQNFRAMLDFQI